MYSIPLDYMPDDHWLCVDCGKNCFTDLKDYYMVKNEIWENIGVGEGMLCMDCMETRLGHKLTVDDILVCELTGSINPYTKNILARHYLSKQKNQTNGTRRK